jgi:hypothetical protein
MVLGQLPTEVATPTTIVGAFIAVTMLLAGLLVWMLRYVFMTTIPAIMATAELKHAAILAEQKENRECYEAEQKAARECFEATINRVCEKFGAEGAAERKLCADQFASQNAALVALTAVLHEEREVMVATINAHTTEQATAYRHDLYDKLNQAVLGKELYLAQQVAARQKDVKPDGGV